MKKREIFMLSSLTFSLGIVIGFFISPVKKGITTTSIGGNVTNNYSNKHLLADENHKNTLQ
jgi:hypothetical protein